MNKIPVLRPSLGINFFKFLSRDKKGLIESFEKKFAKYIGRKYAIFTNSGTFSLYLCLKELDLERGDEIVISALMVKEVVDVINMLRLKPVFVDIDETYNIDPDLINSKITKKTKLILLSHLFGNPAKVHKILNIAKKNNIMIIEDAAQSLGIEYKGKNLGSFGELSYFSFGLLKDFTTLGGGMILTDNLNYYKNIKKKTQSLRKHSKIQLFKKWLKLKLVRFSTSPIIFNVFTYPFMRLFGKKVDKYFRKEKLTQKVFVRNFGYGVSQLQAFVGLQNIETIEKDLKKKLKISKLYSKKLNQKSGNLRVFYLTPKPFKLSSYLLDNGIQSSLGFINSYVKNSKAEKTRKQLLFLPFFTELSVQHIIYISERIKDFNAESN